jgi:Protein of unknown function (DUF2510)
MREGWFDDPRGMAYQRYWDGQKWTEWVAGPPTPSQLDQLNELRNNRWMIGLAGLTVSFILAFPRFLHGW